MRVAELPDVVRGYESVKLRNVAAHVAELDELGIRIPEALRP